MLHGHFPGHLVHLQNIQNQIRVISMNKVRFLLIIGTCLGLTGCTPAEVQMGELIVHEAVVAEEAIVHDIECPGEAEMHPPSNPGQIKNQRQYPKRTNRPFDRGV